MTDDNGTGIPVDAHPDPVLEYAVSGATASVTSTNGAFDAAFGDLEPEAPVAALFEQFDVVESTGDADPATQLARGETAGIYVDDVGEGTGAYFARVVPAGDATGYVTFTAVDDYPDAGETAGIDEVASVISHDLRNPLDVAEAHLRAARETGDPDHFDAVAGAHDRMERIIGDVLALAEGPDAVDPDEEIAVESAARDAWRSVDTEAATLSVSGPLPTATADADRLRRLFENLFRNAVEHGSTSPRSQAREDAVEHGSTSSRSGTDDAVEHGPADDCSDSAETGVSVTVGPLDDGFYVADDGPGIRPDERDAVFAPGYTAGDGGTGLGLAIVDRIAAAHGWDLSLTAARDGGARFEVQF